jgi:hypothetical protein
MKKILFSMFYSILVGEEPDSVFLKKKKELAIYANFIFSVLARAFFRARTPLAIALCADRVRPKLLHVSG